MTERYLVPDWPAPANIRALVTTREGGASKPPFDRNNLGMRCGDDPAAVKANRQHLADFIGDPVTLQWLKQVHGNRVVGIDGPVGEDTEADALYTRSDNIACGILTADCLSVLFCDTEGREIAVAHGGWRGLASGILQRTVDQFQAPAASILGYLGPAIGPCHFEVGADVRDAFLALEIAEIHNQAPILFQEADAPGKWMADLYAIAKIILASKGIRRIYGEPLCTYCEFDRFYSYRRDGETGRFATLIWKES